MTPIVRTLFLLIAAFAALNATPAFADKLATEGAFDRLEESLRPQVEEGALSPRGIGPSMFVGAQPAFEKTSAWFPGEALSFVVRMFGAQNIRVCEACMNPRVYIREGLMEHNSVLSLQEIVRIDTEVRGAGAPARSAIWLDETVNGVSLRIVSLENGQVLYAANIDNDLQERKTTANNYNLTVDLGRRLRGESLSHVFIDIGMLPGQHISIDFAEQFGPYNHNLAGLTLSIIDPVVGIGLAYYRVIPFAFNLTLGVQVIMSVPTALVTAIDQDSGGDLIDPLATGVAVLRFPIPHTSIALLGTASTNGAFSVGVTLMNFSILPVLP